MTNLRRTVSEANFSDDLTLKFPWKIEENSDHYTFYSHQIAVLMCHTGLHNDYHRPSDDIEGVNFEGLQATTRLVLNVLIRLSAADTKLGPFREACRYEGDVRQREFEQALAPPAPRLGISWDPDAAGDEPGLTVQNVRPGSAADRAGLRRNDRLLMLNGQPLVSSTMLQQTVVAASEIQLRVRRVADAVTQELSIPLDGSPARLGISWRLSTAEPNSVTVVRIVRHSVADQAGLRVGDRIHLLGGAAFADSQEFLQLAQRVELPATVRIERTGRIQELMLPAPAVPELAVRRATSAQPN
jgi:predicted metalloprotease with PDZ domain